MELVKARISKIQNSENELLITIPKEKNKVLIVLFGFFSLYGLIGIINTIQAVLHLHMIGFFMLLVFIAISYYSIRELIWQITGETILSISENTFEVIKKSKLRSSSNKYDLSKIKSFDHRDVSSGTGPLAMLQLLRITNRHKLIFTHGYGTITLISDLDVSEVEELASMMNQKIASYSKS